MKNRFLLIFFLFACNCINAQVKCNQGYQDKLSKEAEQQKKAVDAIVMGWYSVDPNEMLYWTIQYILRMTRNLLRLRLKWLM